MEKISLLDISNYKSIKHLQLDCNRINLFIGEPNVGKSNILEALDLSYLSWMLGSNAKRIAGNVDKENTQIDIKRFFRADKVADLFYEGDLSKTISISHSGFSVGTQLQFIRQRENSKKESAANYFSWTNNNGNQTLLDQDFNPLQHTNFYSSPIKPYRFLENLHFHDIGNYYDSLMPPYGSNLPWVIKNNKPFREFVGQLMAEYDEELNIDQTTNRLFIQKRLGTGLITTLPYEALADTLRRNIFYTAAIRCSNSSVITLEEPDTHSFPKFVSHLADEIIEQEEKQFFIATHNPNLLNSLIDRTPKDELAVFVCGFDKEEGTKCVKLTNENLSELLDYGVDIFFNLNHYLDDGFAYSA